MPASLSDLAAELKGGSPTPEPGAGANGPLEAPLAAPGAPPVPAPRPADAANPLAGLAAELKQGQQEDDDLERGFTAYRASNTKDTPERAAQVVHLAAAAKLDPSYVSENFDAVQKNVQQEALDRALQARPKVLDLMRRAAEPAPIKDDVAALGWLEWGVTGQWRLAHKQLSGFGADGLQMDVPMPELVTAPAPLRALRDAVLEQEYVRLANKQLLGQASPDDVKRLDELEAYQNRDYGANTWFSKAMIGTAKAVPYLGGNVAARAAGGFAGAALAGGAAAPTGPGELAALPAGAAAGQHLAGMAFDFYQNVGTLWRQLRTLKRADGTTLLSDDEARAYAIPTALALSTLTSGLAGVALKGTPFASALEKFGQRAIAREFGERDAWRLATDFTKNWGKHAGAGALMMATQAAGNTAVEQLALAQHGEEWSGAAIEQAFGRAFKQGLADMALLTAWEPAQRLMHQRGLAAAVETESAHLEVLAGSAESSKYIDRLPQEAKDAIAKWKDENGAVKNVIHDIEAWDRHWQSKKVDPREAAAHVFEDGGKAYDEAKATGAGDLPIPVEKYVVNLLKGSPENALVLRQDAKLTADSMTPRQYTQWDALQKKLRERMTQEQQPRADGAPTPEMELKGIYDWMYHANLAVGRSSAQSDANAALIRDAIGSIMASEKMSAVDVLTQFPLRLFNANGKSLGDYTQALMQAARGDTALRGTKAVDEAGKPLRVYRGSASVEREPGRWFSSSAETASLSAEARAEDMDPGTSQANVTPAYLQMTNPLVVDGATLRDETGRSLRDLHPQGEPDAPWMAELAAKEGRDGLILRNVSDAPTVGGPVADTYWVRDPSQVQPALERGRPADALHQLSPEARAFGDRVVEALTHPAPEPQDEVSPPAPAPDLAGFEQGRAAQITELRARERELAADSLEAGDVRRQISELITDQLIEDGQITPRPEWKQRLLEAVEKTRAGLMGEDDLSKRLVEMGVKEPAGAVRRVLAGALEKGAAAVDRFFQLQNVPEWADKTREWMKARTDEKGNRVYSDDDIERRIAGMAGQLKIVEALGVPFRLDWMTSREAAADLAERMRLPKGAGIAGQTDVEGMGGPIRANQDDIYKVSFDASAMCVKRLESQATVAYIQGQLGKALEDGHLLTIQALFKAAGKSAPCIYCYVEAARAKISTLTNRAMDIAFQREGASMDELDARTADFAQRAQQEIAAKGIKPEQINPSYFTDPSWRETPEGKAQQALAPATHDFLTMRANQAGVNQPKLYEEYSGQILQASQKLIDTLNGYAGFRLFSSSDFQAEHVIDLLQAVMDLELRGAKAHAYTKVKEFVDIFGATGMKIQMSIFAEEGKDAAGNPTFTPDTFQGFDWEEAKAYREKFPNAGTVLVATSDAQVRWAKEQPWIDFIIPYHRSGLRPKFFKELGWQDFTGVQSEKWTAEHNGIARQRSGAYYKPNVEVRKAAGGGFEVVGEDGKVIDTVPVESKKEHDARVAYRGKSAPEYDRAAATAKAEKRAQKLAGEAQEVPKVRMHELGLAGGAATREEQLAAVNRYLDLAKERGITPVFEDYLTTDGKPLAPDRSNLDPNFLKLKKDYARTDSPFQPVKANFDLAAAQEVLKRHLRGETITIENAKPDHAIAKQFIDAYRAAGSDAERMGTTALADLQAKRQVLATLQHDGAIIAGETDEGALISLSRPKDAVQVGPRPEDWVDLGPMRLHQASPGGVETTQHGQRIDFEHPESPLRLVTYDEGDRIEAQVLGFGKKATEDSASIKEHGGQGYSTALYVRALEEAQARGKGFASDDLGRVTDATVRMYERLQSLGIPFEKKDGRWTIDADTLQGIDLDKAWRTLLAETEIKQLRSGMRLSQSGPGERGYLEFSIPGTKKEAAGEPVRLDMYLLQTADASTFAHEATHALGIMLGQLAQRGTASEQIKKNYAAMLKFMGYASHDERMAQHEERRALTKKGDQATPAEKERLLELTAKEEKLSHAFEMHLLEGKAPTRGLAGTFAQFKIWLTKIYGSVQGIQEQFRQRYGQELTLSPEIREVFDNLLRSESEVERATRETQGADFSTALEGLEDKDRELLEKAEAARKTQAEQELMFHLVSSERRTRQAFLAGERERIRQEVTAGIDQQPGFRALRILRGRAEAEEVPVDLRGGDGQVLKIDRDELNARYDKHYVSTLPPGISTKEGGLPLDHVAEALQFSSGDELVKALQASRNRSGSVEAQVQARMEDQFRDVMNDPGSYGEAAVAAVHNEARAREIVEAMHVISRQLRPDAAARFQVLDPAAMEREAERLTAEKRLADLSPATLQRAELASAQRAFKAAEKGDLERAYMEKETQLFDHYLWKAARDAQDRADANMSFVRRAASDEVKAELAKAGDGYLEARDTLLDSLELRASVSQKEVARRAGTQAWLEKQSAANRDVYMPESVLANLDKTRHWKDLTVGELQDIRDSLESILHIAATKDELKTKEGRRQKAAVLAEIEDRLIQTYGEQAVLVDRNTLSFKKKALKEAKKLGYGLLRLEELFRQADGGDPNGPLTRYLWRPISDATNRWGDLAKKIQRPVLDELSKRPMEDKIRWRNERFTVNGQVYTMEAALAVALNWGNASNRKKLIEGWSSDRPSTRGVTPWNGEATAKEFLDHLTKADWDLVERIGKQLESLWPEMAELEKRVNGLVPQKVKLEPFEVQTSDGQTHRSEGYYYPVVYDPRFSNAGAKQEAKQDLGDFKLFSNAAERMISPQGHLQARIEDYSRPVELSIIGLYRHLSHATKDIAMREALINVYDLIRDDRFAAAVQRTMGGEALPVIRQWLQDAANELVVPDGGTSTWLKLTAGARRGFTGAAFGLHIGHAIHNTLGFLNSATRVESSYLATGVARVIAERGELFDWIHERSSEMRNREHTLDRDLRESMRNALESGSEALAGVKQRAAQVGMWAFQAGDAIASHATWLGAYLQAIDGRAEGLEGGEPGHVARLEELLKAQAAAEAGSGPALSEEEGATLERLKKVDAAAIEHADSTVRQTLMASRTIDLPAVSRDPRMKWLTMFYGWASVQLNQLLGAGADAHRLIGEKEYGRALRRISRAFFFVVLGEVAYEMAMGRGPEEDDDTGKASWSKWIAHRAVLAPFSFIPIAGSVLKAAERGGKGLTLNPTENLYEGMAKTLVGGARLGHALLAGEDGEWRDELHNFGPALVESAASATGLPVSQVRQTLRYWLDEERDRNAPLGQDILGTAYGKRRKGSLSAAIYGAE